MSDRQYAVGDAIWVALSRATIPATVTAVDPAFVGPDGGPTIYAATQDGETLGPLSSDQTRRRDDHE